MTLAHMLLLFFGAGVGGGGVRKCCLYRKTKEESQIEI